MARQFQSWSGSYVNKSATGRQYQGWAGVYFNVEVEVAAITVPEMPSSFMQRGQTQPVIEPDQVIGI